MHLCKFQNMDKCAMNYCDFWNEAKHTCAIALEIHLRVELLEQVNKILEKASKDDIHKVTATLVDNTAAVGIKIH